MRNVKIWNTYMDYDVFILYETIINQKTLQGDPVEAFETACMWKTIQQIWFTSIPTSLKPGIQYQPRKIFSVHVLALPTDLCILQH